MDTQSSLDHCGACDTPCPTLPHAQATCAEGQCSYTCDAGFSDCDADLGAQGSNGCESSLSDDVSHCGVCALSCPTNSNCDNGVCVGDYTLDSPCSGSDPYCLGSGRRTVFRFRSPVNTSNSWQSSGTWYGAHPTITNSRGPGLSTFVTTDFDGTSTAFVGASGVTVQSVGFTISGLFLNRASSGIKGILSTTESWRGFSFKIDNGQLRALVRVMDGSNTVEYQLHDPNPIPLDQWVYAHMQVARSGSSLRVRIYRDGALVAEGTYAALDGLAQSTAAPCVGAEPTSNVPDSGFFDGEIYSVELRDWPVAHNILVTPQLRGGGRYLGRPSYHDYLSTTHDLLRRQENALYNSDHTEMELINHQYGIPYLNDNYIPQGFEIDHNTGHLFMAYYYKDTSGLNENGYPSLVVVADPYDGSVLHTLRLFHTNGSSFVYHVGGIGAMGNNLYVSSNSRVYRFNLAAKTLVDSGTPGQGPPEYSVNVAEELSTGVSSYMDINDLEGLHGALYVGSFSETGYGIIKRYELAPQGALSGATHTADFTLPIVKVQGAVPFVHQGNTAFLLSTSYGDHPSSISLWIPPQTSVTRLACLPAGLEDIDIRHAQVWSWMENGGKYFQREAPAPGIASIPMSSPSISTSSSQE